MESKSHSKTIDEIKEVFDALGIKQCRPYNGNKELMFSCPFPGHKTGDNNPSASYSLEKDTFNCFTCGAKGTLKNLYKQVTGEEMNSIAYATIREKCNKNKIDRIIDFIKKPATVYYDNTILMSYQDVPEEAKQYLINRLKKPEIIADWELGYDPRTRRITMPVRSQNKTLVAIIGHQTQNPKYIPIVPKEGYEKLKYLYGMHKIDRNNDTAILVEGMFDVISGYALGYTNVYGMQGLILGSDPLKFLQMNFNNIILALDNDQYGIATTRALKKTLKKLFHHVTIYRYPNGAKDFGDIVQKGLEVYYGEAATK
jgi:DNA primase